MQFFKDLASKLFSPKGLAGTKQASPKESATRVVRLKLSDLAPVSAAQTGEQKRSVPVRGFETGKVLTAKDLVKAIEARGNRLPPFQMELSLAIQRASLPGGTGQGSDYSSGTAALMKAAADNLRAYLQNQGLVQEDSNSLVTEAEDLVRRCKGFSFTSDSLTNEGGRNAVLAWQERPLAAGPDASAPFLALLKDIKKLAQLDDDPGSEVRFAKGTAGIQLLADILSTSASEGGR